MTDLRRALDKSKSERRVIAAAMRWLAWMERVHRAEAWLKIYSPKSERAIPDLLRATDSLRKARRAKR